MSKRIEALEKPPIKYPANVQLLGVFQTDAVMSNQDAANKLPIAQEGVMTPNQPPGVTTIQNGADFRRARLAGKAALANNINAFMQFDFAFPGRPTFTDLWIDYTNLPFLGTVRIGQWKQPFSLEVVSSFRYTTMMERSSLFIPFTPFRHLGVGDYSHAEDLTGTWAASYFRTGQDQSAGSLSTRGGNGFAGRVTRLGWYDEDARRSYLHLGGAYYFSSPPQRSVIFRTPPEIFVGESAANGGTGTAGFQVPGTFNGTPFFANTGTLTDVNNVNTFGLEALWVHGPLSVQSEAMAAHVNREDHSNSLLHGEYVQVGYFLTGEHRPYDRVFGVIDRVRPFEDFFWVRTADGSRQNWRGAWEVAVRFSHLDLEDNNVSGGILNDITFGVNWYTNPFTKIVFNYIHAWRQSPTPPHPPPATAPPSPSTAKPTPSACGPKWISNPWGGPPTGPSAFQSSPARPFAGLSRKLTLQLELAFLLGGKSPEWQWRTMYLLNRPLDACHAAAGNCRLRCAASVFVPPGADRPAAVSPPAAKSHSRAIRSAPERRGPAERRAFISYAVPSVPMLRTDPPGCESVSPQRHPAANAAEGGRTARSSHRTAGD